MSEYKPNKPTLVTFAIHDPTQWQQVIDACDGLHFWAYIYHDNDVYTFDDYSVKEGIAEVGQIKPKHLHVVAIDSPKTFKSWGNRFMIPDFMIEWRNNRKSALLYLTHESLNAIREGKFKYDRKEVICSDPVKYQEYITTGDIPDYKQELCDIKALRSGAMSVYDYLDKHPDLLATTSVGRLNVYRNLFNIYNKG